MNDLNFVLAIFAFLLGLCVGSFLNVVIWRLPNRGRIVAYQGKSAPLSLRWPPSHCPACDQAIPFYHNIPVFGWLMLRGHCARCKSAISVRYPLVELGAALCFCGLFLAYAAGRWAHGNLANFYGHWPVFMLDWTFIAALLAAAAIDADWFIIPLDVPILLTALALVAIAFHGPGLPELRPGSAWARAGVGAFAGLIIANILLWAGVLPRSFIAPAGGADPAPGGTPAHPAAPSIGAVAVPVAPPAPPASSESVEKISGPPAVSRIKIILLATAVLLIAPVVIWFFAGSHVGTLTMLIAGIVIFLLGVLPRAADTDDVTDEVMEEVSDPHARRDILKELLFVAIPLATGIAAAMMHWSLPHNAVCARLAAVLLGIVAAGGVVWMIRILGTLAFGRVAMGQGDVYLMAAVGAVIGAPLGILAFVFAPFVALIWAAVLKAMGKPNVLPFGPWLAVASIVVLLIGQPVAHWYERRFLPYQQHSRVHAGYQWPGGVSGSR